MLVVVVWVPVQVSGGYCACSHRFLVTRPSVFEHTPIETV